MTRENTRVGQFISNNASGLSWWRQTTGYTPTPTLTYRLPYLVCSLRFSTDFQTSVLASSPGTPVVRPSGQSNSYLTESCNTNFRGGITANQIIRFLNMHMMSTNKMSAHIPPTITDQIRLWEQERDRSDLTGPRHQSCLDCDNFVTGSSLLRESSTTSSSPRQTMRPSRTTRITRTWWSGATTRRGRWWSPRMVTTM